MKLDHALVTGASSGIGRALCRLLTREGVACSLVARDEKALARLSSELRGSRFFSADLATESGRQRVVADLKARTPALLVNCAGFGLYGEALSHDVAEQVEVLEVNGRAVIELTLEAALAMRKKALRGVILNISSAAAFVPFPFGAVYAAAKACVHRFSISLDLEMREQGIRILTACPGEVATRFRERASKAAPQRRSRFVMSPEDAARKLVKQIKGKKTCMIFDWKTQLGIALARSLPKRLVGGVIRRRLALRTLQTQEVRRG